PPPLLPGWTEHTAPTGHKYYYNAETKKSTYTRPTLQPPVPIPAPIPAPVPAPVAPTINYSSTANPYSNGANFAPQQWNNFGGGPSPSTFTGGRGYQERRPKPQDRPKHKYVVPGCEPWVVIKTRLGRRFVHNTETGESLWRFPEHVMKAVLDWDVKEIQKKERRERGEPEEEEEESAVTLIVKPANDGEGENEEGGSEEEYEEVEVTDDEEEDEDEDGDGPSKRQKTDDQPVEFNEDDIAYQLQAMGEEYGLDEGEYGMDEEEDWEEGAEGLPLTEEDSMALFRDLLDDHAVNPYRTWDQIIEDGRIIDDERYTALPNMKSRRDAFSDWSREKIQVLKEQREKEAKKDPRIPYLEFLQQKATPKLYWPEFKRKYRKEPEMKDNKVSDKDREKYYRDHIKRLLLPESTRKADLSALLRSIPLSALNRSTSINALPPALLTDLRYISLSPGVRDPLIETYIITLPPAPDSEASGEDTAEAAAKMKDRARREKALAEREKRVQEDKNRQRRELEFGKGRLREEERELERAMQVGKDGLRSQLSGLDRD
ncbi:hypothetical protein NA57DRAFT_12473, partial [Rhizodiscina lignyota]